MSESDRVPLMFQAQIEQRGKIQYAGNPEPAKTWVKQWLEGCPQIPEQTNNDDVPIWKRRATKPTVKLPSFGRQVKVWEYQISWRLVTNCGQDQDVIRPVIGAKGLPFFPGASMKGAFLRACPPEKRLKYCGGESVQNREPTTEPGILRFHGGYPVDMSWAQCDRLVDLVHEQQTRQVENSSTTRANILISLYKPKFKFGISSTKHLSDNEWKEIKQIWEQALAQGIGSRVSAGYGYFDEVQNPQPTLLSVHLQGQGLTSKLLTGKEEFRPNLFKATLRGHTLRILAGLTDGETAKDLTKKLWGGIGDRDNSNAAIVGAVAVHFTELGLELGEHDYRPGYNRVTMPTYDLQDSELSFLSVKQKTPQIKKFVRYLVMFAMLFGGFGKSWRRVHHQKFNNRNLDYFQNGNKPMIGCHWEFLPESETLYVTAAKRDLSSIARFIEQLQAAATEWMISVGEQPNCYEPNWREAWHRNKVQVWGRIAKNETDSRAIMWFHGDYLQGNSIKNTNLTGTMGQIGRIWHRMYPRYVVKDGKQIRLNREYVELLTIFPDNSACTQAFQQYLGTQDSGFSLLWGNN